MDDLPLFRAIEFLDYMGRAPGMQVTMGTGPRKAVDEQDALGQFSSLQAMLPGVSAIPPKLREAIAWAEGEKVRRGIN